MRQRRLIASHSPRMQENVMILSECEEINSLLYKPIATTRRIKYTCMSVSKSYMILGSTSGSLYLFDREPCAFRQLIPLSEGPVARVVASPDEKTVALATMRGTVHLIAVKPTPKLSATSCEHIGETITSLCWNDNSSEIYIGDATGKISTVLLSIFGVNGMFQTPSCALMHLDSAIVQMEFSGHLLLVSTMTRCYMCDTMQERFKQIGNKVRSGEFGACFLKKSSIDDEPSCLDDPTTRERMRDEFREGTVDPISEGNGDATTTEVYCARPGCRLWQATTDGTVIKTHQFKEALAVPPCVVYRSDTINVSKKDDTDENRKSLRISANFSRLRVIRDKYLFSYSHGSICVVDPTNAAVILWSDEYPNVAMASTINDRVYLMTDNGTFHCLRLVTVETLVLELYDEKRYEECLQACESLMIDQANAAIAKSEQRDAAATLEPIISLVRSNLESQPIKLSSGIVLVNSGNEKFRRRVATNERDDRRVDGYSGDEGDNGDEDASSTEPVIYEIMPKRRDRSIEETAEANDNSSALNLDDGIDSRVTITDDFSVRTQRSREIEETTFNIQNDLRPVHALIDTLKPSMTTTEREDTITRVRRALRDVNGNYGKEVRLKDFVYEILRSTERHYYKSLLENTTREFILNTRNETVLHEILKSFVDSNTSRMVECTCGYLCPTNDPREPKFLEIGRALLEKLNRESKREDCIEMCNSVGYMWRYYLPMSMLNSCIPDDVLRACLRTRDSVVLSTILPKLDARQWDIAVERIGNEETDICPSCGRKNDDWNQRGTAAIDWSEIARHIVKRDGASSALSFLLLAETLLPNITLNRSIFQSLVFTKILDHSGLDHFVDFERYDSDNEGGTMCSPRVRKQLMECIEKDLEKSMEKRNILGSGAHHWGMRFGAKSSTCPCCTLSLHTPVLLGDNGISLFPCGHAYHVNCLVQKKLSRCNLHW